MNKIILIGNLGKEPEMKYTENGTAVTRFTLAVNHSTKSTTGEREEHTEWFNIVAWRTLAEICGTYLHKGQKIYIEGRLSQRKYADRQGVERLFIEVEAREMEMLTPKAQSQEETKSDIDLLDELDVA